MYRRCCDEFCLKILIKFGVMYTLSLAHFEVNLKRQNAARFIRWQSRCLDQLFYYWISVYLPWSAKVYRVCQDEFRRMKHRNMYLHTSGESTWCAVSAWCGSDVRPFAVRRCGICTLRYGLHDMPSVRCTK